FAVDQEARSRRRGVCDLRAVASALLADDEQERDTPFAGPPHALDGGHLRREDPFRIARTATEQTFITQVAREERRHAVEVRRQDDARVIEPGVDVEPSVRDGLALDGVAELRQL